MAKRVLQAIQRWRYLGYNRETVLRHRAETDRANLGALKRICAVSIFLLLACDAYAAVYRSSAILIFASTGVLVFFLLYHLTMFRLKNVPDGAIFGARALVVAASAALYLCGIYAATHLAGNELGVMSVWMFLFVQIAFNVPPVQNFLTVLPMAALFLIVSRLTKSDYHFQIDTIHTLISVFAGLFLSQHQAQLALDNIIAKNNLLKANFALYHTATTDELTGLMNRRMLFDRYNAILNESVKKQQSVACIVLDIDDYKQFNDSYGHPEGDRLLRRIGETLRAYSGKNGIEIGRIGGEEFLAVWPEESVERCERVAEELRATVESMAIPHTGAAEHEQVTMSVGLCLLPSTLAQSAYFFADKALYRAKEAGKNCSCRYDLASGFYQTICRSNAK